MSIRIRDSVASLPDYSEADLRDAGIRIRMHRNECPVPPPSHVVNAIRNVPADVLRTYPAELGIEVREDDHFARAMTEPIGDADARVCAAAERAFLGALGAGCTLPAGAYALRGGDTMRLWGMLARPDGSRLLRETLSGPAADAEALGRRLAEALLAAGGAAFLGQG